MHTRCGAYAVHFRSDGNSEFLLHVRETDTFRRAGDPKQMNTEKTSVPLRCYSASLTEEEVKRITFNAGVQKSFHTFAQMTYHALIGKSTSLSFYVETRDEMRERIAEDVRQRAHSHEAASSTYLRMEDQEHTSALSHAPLPTMEDNAPATTSASRQTEPMFLTIDYDVDFTRAIFPLPLNKVALGEQLPESVRGGQPAAVGSGGMGFLAERSEGRSALPPPHLTHVTPRNSVTPPLPSPTALMSAQDLPHNNDSCDRGGGREGALGPSKGNNKSSDHLNNGRGAVSGRVGDTSESASGVDRQHLEEALRLIQVLHTENAALKKENKMLSQLSRERMKEMQHLCDKFEEGTVALGEVKRLKEKNVKLRIELDKAKESAVEAYAEIDRLRRRYSSRSALDTSREGGEPRERHSTSSRRRTTDLFFQSKDINTATRKIGKDPVSSRSTGCTKTAARHQRLQTPPPPCSRSAVTRSSSNGSSRADRSRGGGTDGRILRSRLDTPETPARGRRGGVYSLGEVYDSDGRMFDEGGQERRRCRTHSASSSRASSRSHERLYQTSTAASRERELQRRRAASRLIDTNCRSPFR